MSTKDAYMFPLVGSCVLFGLYLLFKFLNKDYVNFLLTAYIFVLGVFALGGVLKPAFVDFVPKASFIIKISASYLFLARKSL